MDYFKELKLIINKIFLKVELTLINFYRLL